MKYLLIDTTSKFDYEAMVRKQRAPAFFAPMIALD